MIQDKSIEMELQNEQINKQPSEQPQINTLILQNNNDDISSSFNQNSLIKKSSTIQRIKRINKNKVSADKYYDQTIPQFLLFLHSTKVKSIIRLGEQYQVNVLQYPTYQSINRNFDKLRVWNGCERYSIKNPQEVPFDYDVLQKFRQNFGQNRTQQQLILLLKQYQCNWNQLSNNFIKRKIELRKYYSQKDRQKL